MRRLAAMASAIAASGMRTGSGNAGFKGMELRTEMLKLGLSE